MDDYARRSSRRRVRQGGFTLVELLVVIIIIGILAAVAIPQFGDASSDAKIAALDQNLSCVRSAIELYYYQHNNTYPGTVGLHATQAASAPSAHANASTAFSYQLTMYSNANGDTCAQMNAAYPYGPYLRSGVPPNPLPAATAAGAPSAVNVKVDTTPLTADNSPATGWKVSSSTGQFIANNSAYASR